MKVYEYIREITRNVIINIFKGPKGSGTVKSNYQSTEDSELTPRCKLLQTV